ncbi:MAG: GNAT family N-acetyltransferase [Algoriphagus sp.]|uniref:GNAT family N-acetyltransferase n=1 Tax=Algoriphagus sp. TaxID=1872435 RepID=UPI0026134C88|nr:GNAT family N-acetyltransferase [Algoriphagus sp.]MDG1279200.1 GNAT family N-acetyltransferase [Algoriphagus sp.]
MKISFLPFDSNLFGYPVGKVEISNNWNEAEFLHSAKEFHLVYLFSENPLEVKTPKIKAVDTKLIFEKELLANQQIIKGIELYQQEKLNPKLQDLAFQSGVYSRFKIDRRLNHLEFEKLYSTWIQKAFDEDFILTDSDLNGMITCSIQEEKASIGLFAVSEKSKKTGLGTKLIQAAEETAQINGGKSLLIATQAANNAACKLYFKLGYQLLSSTSIFHYYNA